MPPTREADWQEDTDGQQARARDGGRAAFPAFISMAEAARAQPAKTSVSLLARSSRAPTGAAAPATCTVRVG